MRKRSIGMVVALGMTLAGCGRPTAEVEFATAEKAEAEARAKMDTVRSEASARAVYLPVLAALETVVADYPNNALSETCLFRIANIRNNNTHEVQEAVDTYRLYIERYPRGKHTELSMFLVGYLYNNELHNIDSASAVYRRFLAQYPESQYAVSAQFELNTLGRPLEELLPKSPEAGKQTPKKQSRKAHL